MAGVEIPAVVLAIFETFHTVAKDFLLLHAVTDSKSSLQTHVTILASAQLQLTRWGKSVGIDVNTKEEIDLDRLKPESDRELARGMLKTMQARSAEARGRAEKYSAFDDGGSIGGGPDGTSASEHDMEALRKNFWQTSISRVRKASAQMEPLPAKTKWAIYEKKVVLELLGYISQLMHDLETLFGATETTRRELEEQEMKELPTQEMTDLIKQVQQLKADHDKLFREAQKNGEGEEQQQPKAGGSSLSFAGKFIGVGGGRDVIGSSPTFHFGAEHDST